MLEGGWGSGFSTSVTSSVLAEYTNRQITRGGPMSLKMNLADMLKRPHGYMLARVPGISFLSVGFNCLVTLWGRQSSL